MRDPARIDRILAMVAHEWKKSPDQRLGQLLSNSTNREFFDSEWNAEDSAIEAALIRNLYGDTEMAKELVERERKMAEASWAEFFRSDMPHVIAEFYKLRK